MDYSPAKIEPKWQKYWLTNRTFRSEAEQGKPKYYVLDMFPYPSGSGLHVGHPEGYTATDIVARYKRMCGLNVLHPMGWDAFGLPAEQHAVKTGTHPKTTTAQNIATFKKQIQSMGMSYDWEREINTTDETYYKWTQWIFLQLYKKGLAYESYAPVNWCEELGTVLANEEVIDGKSEVGGYDVVKKPIRQWVLKITDYAEKLLEGLDDLDWPDAIKEQQRNWIGRSTGADVRFTIQGHDDTHITVFTTRPDTLFGATFFVLAPEHPVVEKITSAGQKAAVDEYVRQTLATSERERISKVEKTGVFTGARAINPVNGEAIPVYIADYVLATYGHGAIMAVPGHDERDHEFATKYGIPIKRVLTGGEADISQTAHIGDGQLVNSGFLDGLTKQTAIDRMCAWLAEKGVGKKNTTYKLRDWLFSRQRYWGEPIPLARDKDGRIISIEESDLPVVLPAVEDYRPAGGGESPLAKASDWLTTEIDGRQLTRETNTMPQWAGSCWYYLRYIDPLNQEAPWDAAKEEYWMPVDLYVGGAEHAVLHLLYSRFWHKVLYDLGHVSTSEPFKKLVNQGMILGSNGEKMSKSRGNVVNPDDVINAHGADAFRLYEMFMGPLESTKPWQTNGITGCSRFLQRTWRLLIGGDGKPTERTTGKDGCHSDSFDKLLHKTIKKVREDTEAMRFNTAIAAMMEFINQAYKESGISRQASESFILLLSPYAPHIGEELWQRFGHANTLAYESPPEFDPARCVEDLVTLSIQVNGKLRGTLDIAKDAAKDEVLDKAKVVDTVVKHLDGKTIRKEIFVPGRIVNFVVS